MLSTVTSEIARMLDEGQPFPMTAAIASLIAFRPLRFRQKTHLLVVPDRLDLDAGLLRECANRHHPLRNRHGHDRTNGRLFNIVYGEPKTVSLDLAKWSDMDLANHQLAENDWFVRHARRLLQERAAAGTLNPDVRKVLAERVLTESESPKRLRCLWALHATGPLDAGLVDTVLSHADADVRAWTMQLITEPTSRQRGVSDAVAATVAKLAAADASPTVRLYASSALQRLPMEQRWPIAEGLASHAEDADDHNLPLLTWYGVEPLVMLDPPRHLKASSTERA